MLLTVSNVCYTICIKIITKSRVSKMKTSISEQVYDYLIEMILSMQIKPAERISEEKLAKHFGSSRAPIREALKRLAHEGLVTLYPNRYAEVANYSNELVQQIGVVRIFHDIAAIKLVVLFGCKAEFKRMIELSEQCYQAAIAGDTSLRIKKDCEFHKEISNISKNQQLCKFAQELYIRIEFIQAFRFVDLISPEDQRSEHLAIVDLLINRREKEAIEFITKHNSRFHKISEQYPLEFFVR